MKDEQEYQEVLALDIITEKDFLNIAKIEAKSVKDWTEKVCINETLFIEFKLDSGIEANILPKYIFNKLNNKLEIKENNKSLLVYNKNNLNVLGVCRLLSARYNDVKMDFDFYILEENYEPILGFKSCMQPNLIKRASCIENMKEDKNSALKIIEKYDNVFKGIGCIENQCKIRLQSNYEPNIARCRKLPLALHEQKRGLILKNVKNLKGTKISITEDLDKNRLLLYRKCQESIDRKSVFTLEGNIYVKIEDKKYKIQSETDLEQLIS
ncbi:unnamed protein product [Ceutorhynchus assimilis]|uniref:Uncharacterized protein n=1 Tax=Ceutorhynchus assimilis TaxID=467358 RepID=A0A9N9MDK1_9CUCU|nr:unnamed protein product [Ceutorhynchus assimilis]